MAIMNSKQLWAERNRLADEQRKAAEDQDQDKALVLQGQIEQLDLTITHVIDEEDKLRNAPKPARQAETLAEAILGPRDDFHGLEVGFRNAATVTSVTAPTETELEIPGKPESPFQTFGDTLQEVPAIGSVSYKQRAAQTGAPDTWAGVTDGNSATKAQVIYAWKDAVANQETIAGYVPVSKKSLMDYDDLASVIQSDLLIDLQDKTDGKYLSGSNTTGIVGIINTTGIQAFTTAMGGNYFDAIRKMRTLVMKNSRRVPTHVCISPDVKEAIDLYKTTTGLYQALGDGNYWGMQVIEDINCPGILVYDAYAAKRRAIGGLTVEVGYANDQFIKNELSILAEQTKALQVTYPDAFCYATKTDLDKATA